MGLGFTLELEFSDGDLDGYVDAMIDEFPKPFKVGDHLLQFGNFLRPDIMAIAEPDRARHCLARGPRISVTACEKRFRSCRPGDVDDEQPPRMVRLLRQHGAGCRRERGPGIRLGLCRGRIDDLFHLRNAIGRKPA